MLLRKISLQGFKSFADRLEMSFEPGIAAIVGPNGSGKSNIADAVKWVLGESSARELRGSRMEDVIFAGSAHRRSLGLAEVSLTLDNSDGFLPVEFAEVSVTRRLYRSGESEFLLNHTPCRLRDIQELFLDSGVGRNAYALLSQTEIDSVLSAHPEERRRLFEEAAGVAKFRAKRAEALRRLSETEQNLTRVGDILGELSAQLGPLKEKARRAERHAALSAELCEVEVALLAGVLQEAQQRVAEAGEELTRRETAAAAALAALHRADAAVMQARLAVASADAAREEEAREVLALATELEKVEGQLKAARERRARWTDDQARVATARAELAGKLEVAIARAEERERATAAAEASLAEVRAAAASRAEELAELTALVRRREEELEGQKGEFIERMNETAQLRNELRGLEATRQAAESHRERLAREAEEAQGAVEAARQAVAAAEERRRQAREAVNLWEQALHEVEQEEAAVSEESRRLEKERREGEALAARLRSTWQVLSDWQRNREGYAEGPRAVLDEQAAGRLNGVLGTVAELLRVPVELERAVETALGASLQDVVVRDEEVARQGIQFLKVKRAGRATFLPLALLSPRPLGPRQRRELAAVGGEGFLGAADELVEYPPQVRPAVEYLLGRVLVTRDLETALRVGRACGLRYMVVTTEGDVVRPGGAVTGGREVRNRGLLRRQRQLTEVEAALRAAEERQAQLEHEAKELLRRVSACREERSHLERARRAEEEKVAAAEREAAVRTSELRQAEAAVARIRAELTALDAGAGGQREEELKTRLSAAEGARRALEEAITRGTEELRQMVRRREEAAERLTAAKVALAEREKDAAAAQAEAARARVEVEELLREAAAAGERAADLERRMAETEEQLVQLEAERDALGRRRAEAEQRAAILAQERATVGRALAAAEAEADRARLLRDEAQQNVHEAELQAAKADLEAESVAARLWSEWGVDRATALSQAGTPPEERAAAAERAEALRRRLKALGTVDPEAVGEYAALVDRHSFLSQQYADLTAARARLTEVLSEVERATARQFAETFAAVREEFAALFRRVFGGGRADLRLTDPERPTESGIEVEAQPPGKKNQSLLSLSTGERTLTALALLFAMMRVRPAPFCVLDEVDAALDEANLERFVALLREFAAGMQFVVITHRRQTMEAAEILYGVTMEEPGASQLVSVRLAEAG
ncbi:MAG: chromosome segregation protein SMC [Bacillota bacterium]|nr:chromosome segregation protein SMC [Bacillota bacterium]